MKLAIITAHAGADSIKDAVNSWLGEVPLDFKSPCVGDYMGYRDVTLPQLSVMDGREGMLPAYQSGFQKACGGKQCKVGDTITLRTDLSGRNRDYVNILAFLHDDLIIHDKDWMARVLAEFEDPQVGLVGFGGATRHGSQDLYKVPYDYHQLGRSNFLSNMVDAESHGQRCTTSCDVAVLDGFALIVRREVLEKAGGWPLNVAHDWNLVQDVGSYAQMSTCKRCHYRSDSPIIPPCPSPIGYVCYDYWLSCMTRRLGYRIRLVGVPCAHLGGRTFVKLGIGKDPKHWTQYLESHEYIYNEFKDVLPWEVSQ